MLLDDLNYRIFNERMAALAKDRNKQTRDKPIYVRAHVAFVQAYWRRRARKRPNLRLVHSHKEAANNE